MDNGVGAARPPLDSVGDVMQRGRDTRSEWMLAANEVNLDGTATRTSYVSDPVDLDPAEMIAAAARVSGGAFLA